MSQALLLRNLFFGQLGSVRPGLLKYFLKLSFDHLVALARSSGQALRTNDPHGSISVGDQARLLEHASGSRYGWTVHAEHVSQKFLAYGIFDAIRSIVGHAQPPA